MLTLFEKKRKKRDSFVASSFLYMLGNRLYYTHGLFSASTLTCDDMQLLGSGVTAMTSSQIEAMSDSDFIDCAQTLGGYSTWDSSQLLSLLTVATRSGVC